MKKTTFLKTLLVAACLCLGSMSVWAAPTTYLPTLTGRVGTTSNDGNFYYGNKKVKVAAGETYVFTLTNYNNENNAEPWTNWVVEANLGDKYFDCEARGNQWGAGTGAPTPSYTPVINTSDVDNWQSAYNGATVTITVARNAAGTEFTVTHTSNVLGTTDGNTDKHYGGSWTVTVGAAEEWDVYLTEEYSYFDITKVVYTNASGDVTNYERVAVDLSKFDTYFTGSYSDGVATFTNSGNSKVWAKLSLSSYFSGITGTITNVNMKFTENMNDGGRMTIGIYGNDKSSWATNAYQDTGNSVSAWGLTGSSSATRIYYNNGSAESYTTGVTLNSAAVIEVDMDVVNKKFTWIQGGSTKINNQKYCTSEVSLPQYIALYSWSKTNTTTLTDMSMEIVYLEASYYTVTFTNSTSGNSPSVTIYTDEDRTSPIANGMLENGETYYITATETGYNDYKGLFTLDKSDLTVDFAMTAKTAVKSVRVNYQLGGVTKTYEDQDDLSGLYVGDSYNVPFRMYVQNGGHLYKTTANVSNPFYGDNKTLSENTVVNKTVTEVELYGGTIALCVDLDDATSDNAGDRASYCSAYGNKAYTSAENLAAGTYTFIFRGQDRGRGSSVKVGTTEIVKASEISTKNSWGDKTLYNVNIPTADKLTFVAGGSSTIDYYDIIIAIKQTGDIVTVSDADYATYVSANDLDFTSTSIKAYTAKVNTSTGAIVLSEINKVPANTPVILYKDGGATENIPFATSTDAVGDNDLHAGTGAAVATGTNPYNYILNNVSGIGFYKAAGQTVATNRAYLQTTYNVAAEGARLVMVFADDETTGIADVRGKMEDGRSGYFDLQGRPVAQPTKGLYIVNGKKVVIK